MNISSTHDETTVDCDSDEEEGFFCCRLWIHNVAAAGWLQVLQAVK